MIKITKDTFQKLLLTELSGQSKNPGDLYIFVDSLPLFLSTSIAFKIFNYQLRNYPRRVIWAATDDRIVHLMRLGEIPIKENLDIEEIRSLEQESAKPKQLTSTKNLVYSEELTSVDIQTEEKHGEKKQEQYSYSSVLSSINNDQSHSELAKISLKHLFDDGDYNPSSLIDKEENESGILNNGKTIQDLDSWIERIEATKTALNSMKSDPDETIETPSLQDNLKNIIPLPPVFSFNKTKRSQPQAFLFITTFFSFALVFILVMVFFPTNVYTLEVKPAEDSATINLSIPSTSFTKQSIQLNADATIPTSGDDQTGTQRATGRVDLINRSSKTITLTNGSFALLKDGNKYTHLRNTTLPEEITIPAFNEKNPVSIQVQSNEPGADYNLPIDTTFEILNTIGQKPCSSCFGVSTTPIQAGDGSGKKIVTEADQSLLRATVDGALAQQRITKLQEIKEEKNGVDDIVVNNDWYQNTNSNYTFSPSLGESSAQASLTASVQSDIYYLPKTTLNELLQRENNDVDNILDLSILESNGQFGDTATDIKLKLSYKFSKKVDIDKNSIEKTIKDNQDFSKAKEEVQKKYQSITGIEKKELGVKIPWLPPATNIKYITNN